MVSSYNLVLYMGETNMYTIGCYARMFGKFETAAEAKSFLLAEGWVERDADETLPKEMKIELPGGFIHAFIHLIEDPKALNELVKREATDS